MTSPHGISQRKNAGHGENLHGPCLFIVLLSSYYRLIIVLSSTQLKRSKNFFSTCGDSISSNKAAKRTCVRLHSQHTGGARQRLCRCQKIGIYRFSSAPAISCACQISSPWESSRRSRSRKMAASMTSYSPGPRERRSFLSSRSPFSKRWIR